MAVLAILGHSFLQETEKHLQGGFPEPTDLYPCGKSMDSDKLVSEIHSCSCDS